MNDKTIVDEMTLRRDDELLDALGRGEQPPGLESDPVLRAMVEWRAELNADMPAYAPPVTGKAVRRHRRARIAVLAAALAAALGAGVTVAAAGAGPGSPLWPITELMFPERAETTVSAQAARDVLEQARVAVTEQRPGEAQRLLAEAEALIGTVPDVIVQRDLFTELDKIRTEFVATFPDVPLELPPLLGGDPTPETTGDPEAPPQPGQTGQPTSEPEPTPSASSDDGPLPLPTVTILPTLTILPTGLLD